MIKMSIQIVLNQQFWFDSVGQTTKAAGLVIENQEENIPKHKNYTNWISQIEDESYKSVLQIIENQEENIPKWNMTTITREQNLCGCCQVNTCTGWDLCMGCGNSICCIYVFYWSTWNRTLVLHISSLLTLVVICFWCCSYASVRSMFELQLLYIKRINV